MSYSRSAALAYESPEYEYEVPSRRKRLSVHKGGGLDAQARKGVSKGFTSTLQVFLLAVIVFFALGAVRVAITTQTVTLLRENETMRAGIEETLDRNDSLRVERSMLASSERIMAIATDNYGMHLAAASESLVFPDDVTLAEDAAEGTAEEATSDPMTVVMASMD